MIGPFDFHPIGGKGQHTEPVNACFPHSAPDETSSFAFWLARVHFYPIAGKGGPIAACQRVSSCPFRRLPLVVIGSSDCLCLIGQNNCLLHPKKNQHTLIMIIKFYSWISINDFTPNILGKQL